MEVSTGLVRPTAPPLPASQAAASHPAPEAVVRVRRPSKARQTRWIARPPFRGRRGPRRARRGVCVWALGMDWGSVKRQVGVVNSLRHSMGFSILCVTDNIDTSTTIDMLSDRKDRYCDGERAMWSRICPERRRVTSRQIRSVSAVS